MGTDLAPSVLQQTRDLFRPLYQPRPCRKALDVAYGPDPRHRLDIYSPEHAGCPVIMFVPGGGFVGGDKDDGHVFYRNIGEFFVAAGYVCVIANYRLAPQHNWPSGGVDVGAALTWCLTHIADYGGDAEHLFLCGQSAGATHVATAVFGATPDITPTLRGVLLINGLFDSTDTPETPNFDAYFGPRDTRAERSPLEMCRPLSVPVFMALTEHEPRFLASSTLRLADRLCLMTGRCPPIEWLAGHNHVSCVFAIGTRYDDLGPLLLSFCASQRAAATSSPKGA
jgi:acetyl esterase/lipase